MTFRKILILFEISCIGYFVAAHPDLCVELVRRVPAAASAIAKDPKILLRVLPGHDDGQTPLPSVADILSGKVKLPPMPSDTPATPAPAQSVAATPAAPQPEEHTAAIGGAIPMSDVPVPQQNVPQAPAAQVPAPAAPVAQPIAAIAAPQSPPAQAQPAQAQPAQASAGPKADIQPKIVTKETKAAAATVNGAKTEYDKQLDAAFAASDDGSELPAGYPSVSARQPAPTPIPLKTKIIQVERTQVSTRFLHLVVGEATLRFHVANGLSEKDIVRIAENLKNACLKKSENDICDRQRSSVLIDPQFFSDVQSTKVSDWSPGAMPGTGLIWRLTCASGKDECLTSAARSRAYKLTMVRAKDNEITLARGFETRVIQSSFQISNARKPASVANSKMVQRAYVTHASASTMKLNEAGSL